MGLRRTAPLIVAALVLAGTVSCSDEPTYFGPSHAEGAGTPPNPTQEEAAEGAAIAANVMSFSNPAILAESAPVSAWSPLALSSVLAQLRAGSQGEAAVFLDEVFGVDSSTDAFTRAVHAADETIRRLDGPTGGPDGTLRQVDVGRADALWGRSGTTWTPTFLDRMTGGYGASMWMADMEADPDRAAADINGWVREQTGGEVERLLPDGSLGDDSRLVLTSALTFSAPWETPMAQLPDAPFTDPDAPNPEVEVPTIGVDASLVVRRGPGWRSVTIPYAGNAAAMTIAVPEGDTDPGPVELLSGVVPVLAAPADPSDVSLSMPAFAIDAPLGALQAWRPLTVPGGSYAPMTDESEARPRRVDALQQRTVVEVSAAGTSLPEDPDAPARPSAATGVGERFVVSGPFAFVIHDVATGIPMIVGWVREAPTRR